MASTPLPALSIHTEGESPINLLAKAEQIKSAQQSQEMGSIQLQEARLKQQSQQVIMSAWANSNGDPDQALKAVMQSGKALPEDVINLQTHIVDLKTKAATLSDKDLEVQTKQNTVLYNSLQSYQALPPEQRTPDKLQAIMANLANQNIPIDRFVPTFKALAQNSSDTVLKPIEYGLVGQKKVLEDEAALRQEASAPSPAQAQAKIQAELSAAEDKAKAEHIALLSMPTPEEAHTERAAKLLQTQAQTQQAIADTAFKRVQTALASAQPVFAYDPATNQRVQATIPEAKAKGYTDIVPVKEGEIDKAAERTQQFNDVQMNVSRYRNAFKAAPMVTPEQSKLMGTILSDKDTMGLLDKLPAAAITGDVIKAKLKSDAWNHLTPENQNLMTGYLRTTGATGAFQRGLTQGGRLSPELMRIEINNVPLPMEGATVGLNRLGAFQENIDTATQGIVRVKGLPSPHEIRQAIEGPAEQQQQQNQLNFNRAGQAATQDLINRSRNPIPPLGQ